MHYIHSFIMFFLILFSCCGQVNTVLLQILLQYFLLYIITLSTCNMIAITAHCSQFCKAHQLLSKPAVCQVLCAGEYVVYIFSSVTVCGVHFMQTMYVIVLVSATSKNEIDLFKLEVKLRSPCPPQPAFKWPLPVTSEKGMYGLQGVKDGMKKKNKLEYCRLER